MSCHRCQFACMLTYHYHYFSFADQVGFKPVHTVRNVTGREQTLTGQTESSQIYFNECMFAPYVTDRHRPAKFGGMFWRVVSVVVCRLQNTAEYGDSMPVRFFLLIVNNWTNCRYADGVLPLSGNAADWLAFRICSIQIFTDCLHCGISSALVNECRYSPLQ
jgi:hypothetical protein